MGGWSPEREVSLVSGKACAEGLREGGHKVIEYDVQRDLRALVEFLRPAAGGGPDVVFNALHGKYGEDGCIQGVLEILACPTRIPACSPRRSPWTSRWRATSSPRSASASPTARWSSAARWPRAIRCRGPMS